MVQKLELDLRPVAKEFQIYAEFLGAEPCSRGHINDTYTATYNQAGRPVRYIHQRINHHVFTDPPALMRNVERVTAHLRAKLSGNGDADVTRQVLTVIPTREGKSYLQDAEGGFWRTYLFIEKVQTFDAVETPNQAYEAGRAFGHFQKALVDLPGERLTETIPDFHHTAKRFAALERAIAEDRCNRACGARAEIQFALRRQSLARVLLDAQGRGEIPERITHNDTKFNNVMLDETTGRGLCVIDLDTVMPGLVHYDFGDMVRTTTSPAKEDEVDLSKVEMQMPMFEGLARGYVEAAGEFLTRPERACLALAGKLITFTIGIRFLTDHLCGDTYFRIHRPGHNLDRCRTQFKLIESIERQEERMQQFVDRV